MNIYNELPIYMIQISDDPFIWVLGLVIILDVITGMSKAFSKRVINSSIGLNGLIRHSLIILMVLAYGLIAFWLKQDILFYWFVVFYILYYVISIIENLSVLGVPFPEGLKKRILEIKNEKNNEWGGL